MLKPKNIKKRCKATLFNIFWLKTGGAKRRLF